MSHMAKIIIQIAPSLPSKAGREANISPIKSTFHLMRFAAQLFQLIYLVSLSQICSRFRQN